jgi:hypothetical protein
MSAKSLLCFELVDLSGEVRSGLTPVMVSERLFGGVKLAGDGKWCTAGVGNPSLSWGAEGSR